MQRGGCIREDGLFLILILIIYFIYEVTL